MKEKILVVRNVLQVRTVTPKNSLKKKKSKEINNKYLGSYLLYVHKTHNFVSCYLNSLSNINTKKKKKKYLAIIILLNE